MKEGEKNFVMKHNFVNWGYFILEGAVFYISEGIIFLKELYF